MPLHTPGRLFMGDEELGKRDDDNKYSKKSPMGWQSRKVPLRRDVKKIFLGFTALVLLYCFFKYIPKDVQHRNIRPHYQTLKTGQYDPWIPSSAKNAPSSKGSKGPAQKAQSPENQNSGPPRPPGGLRTGNLEDEHYFDGPVKFYQLASTLHKAALALNGDTFFNKNIMFAAANLKSAANLLPLACEMASWKRNSVHFALLGRDDIELELLKSVNSVDSDCDIMFHDARPDFSVFSTDRRMTVSAGAALMHIENYVHPRAVLVDNSGSEDSFLLRAFRDKSTTLGIALIELPRDVAQNLMWLTRLDASSLSVWNQVTIDIVVHAQQAASGSLIRLLTSLWKADYSGSVLPRLTIELPQKIDPPTEQFLQTFKWPPSHYDQSGADLLTLHHRIPKRSVSAEESDMRMVESFWPSKPLMSHILVLSPHAELSPLYFHYLKYTLLEYRHSAAVALTPVKLLGISLDLPTTLLNDKEHFTPPSELPFLWQAPNSNAALYFGTAWQELHSLLSHLTFPHTLPTPVEIDTKKQIASTYPSWLEHLLTLARVRGYFMLYPRLTATSESLMKIHHELYQAPEESLQLMNPTRKEPLDVKELPSVSAGFLSDEKNHLSLAQPESKLAKKSLLDVFYPESLLPDLLKLKFLSWKGEPATPLSLSREVSAYAEAYRKEIGGCGVDDVSKYKSGQVQDLFCYGNDVELEEVKGVTALAGDEMLEDILENVLPGSHSTPQVVEAGTPSWRTMAKDAELPSVEQEKDSSKDETDAPPQLTTVIVPKPTLPVTNVAKAKIPADETTTMAINTAQPTAAKYKGSESKARHEPGIDRIKGTGE